MSENHNYDAPPSTTFTVDGREHRWAYSTNAVIRLESALGDGAVDQLRILGPPENGEKIQFGRRLAVLRALIWAGIEDEPDLTVERIGAELRPDQITELSLELLRCMADGLARNPTGAATATAASAAGPSADNSA